MPEKKNKTVILRLNEVLETMLTDLASHLGASFAEVFRIGLRDLHKKTFKDYIEVQKHRAKMNEKLSPEAQEELRQNRLELQRDMKNKKVFDTGKGLCEALEGDHFKEGNVDYCRFTCYEYMSPVHVHEGQMTLPFEELSEELLEIKWKGGKEKILEVLKKQK